MAKTKKENLSPSLMDFSEENLLNSLEDENLLDNEEGLEEEQEEEDEPVITPVKKTKTAPPAPKKAKKNEPPKPAEPEEEEEEEEQEEVLDSTDTPEGDAEENEEDVSRVFYEKVQSITGVEVEVDYTGVDPISPQGVALREKALVEKTIDDFIERLAEHYPAVHRALEYAHAGGDIADLFRSEKDFSKVTIADDDEAHARLVLQDYYQAKGITNEGRIKRMIDADAETDEGIVKVAQSALAEMVAEQNAQNQQKLVKAQQEQEQARQSDQRFLGAISDLVKGGKLDTFKIPQSETQEFFQYVRQRVQRDGKGGYLLVSQLDPTQLEKQLQAEYFKFKKGDLDKLITIKATSLKAKDLKLRLGGKENQPKSTTVAPKYSGSLKDYEV